MPEQPQSRCHTGHQGSTFEVTLWLSEVHRASLAVLRRPQLLVTSLGRAAGFPQSA